MNEGDYGMLYRIFRTIFLVFFKITNRFRSIGAENLPLTGPVVLASNHISDIDPLVLGSAVKRQVCYIAKDSLFRIPVIGQLIKAWGAFPVRRGKSDREAITRALEVLNKGKVFGIFIEGKRNKGNPNELLKPQPGAAMLAVKSGAQVVPAVIINSNLFLKSFKRITVVIGKPIELEIDPELDKKELYNEISTQIAAEINNLRKQVTGG